jgi:hypothetical protein
MACGCGGLSRPCSPAIVFPLPWCWSCVAAPIHSRCRFELTPRSSEHFVAHGDRGGGILLAPAPRSLRLYFAAGDSRSEIPAPLSVLCCAAAVGLWYTLASGRAPDAH